MPLARMALYAAGEDLHIAMWPGVQRNTLGNTTFVAFESRSYVAAVSGILRDSDIPEEVPLRDQIVQNRGRFSSTADPHWQALTANGSSNRVRVKRN